jgi:hypothetical protein
MIRQAALAGLLLLTGCQQAPQAEGQLPLARPYDQRWERIVMTGGPSLTVACYKGDRLYLLDSYLERANEWHLTSPKTLAVAVGACK